MAKRDRIESDKKAKKRSKKESKKKKDAAGSSGELEQNQESSKVHQAQGQNKVQVPASSAPKTRRSIFLKKKIDVELSLLPSSLHNTDDAVQNSMNQLLMKYSDGLGGIMLACENVRIKADGKGEGRGWILNELPWIHYTVSCDALVFRPYLSCQLQGVVNECFPSHLGLLVLNYFNAMVSSDELRGAGYTYDADLQKWVAEDGGQAIAADSRITFTLEKIHECDGTLSLEGVKPSLSLLVEA